MSYYKLTLLITHLYGILYFGITDYPALLNSMVSFPPYFRT